VLVVAAAVVVVLGLCYRMGLLRRRSGSRRACELGGCFLDLVGAGLVVVCSRMETAFDQICFVVGFGRRLLGGDSGHRLPGADFHKELAGAESAEAHFRKVLAGAESAGANFHMEIAAAGLVVANFHTVLVDVGLAVGSQFQKELAADSAE